MRCEFREGRVISAATTRADSPPTHESSEEPPEPWPAWTRIPSANTQACRIADASTCSVCAYSRAATAGRLLDCSSEAFGSLPRHRLGMAAPRIDVTLSLAPTAAPSAPRQCRACGMRSGAGFLSGCHRRQQLRDGVGRTAARTDVRGSRHARLSLPRTLRAHGVRHLYAGAAGARDWCHCTAPPWPVMDARCCSPGQRAAASRRPS